jgi:hypothetical protein
MYVPDWQIKTLQLDFSVPKQPEFRGRGFNNHILHSTPTQSCKEDFTTKTNSKIEVLFRNLMLLTGVCSSRHVFTYTTGVSLRAAQSSCGTRTALDTVFPRGWFGFVVNLTSPTRTEVMNAWKWTSAPLCILVARLLWLYLYLNENYCYPSRLAQLQYSVLNNLEVSCSTLGRWLLRFLTVLLASVDSNKIFCVCQFLVVIRFSKIYRVFPDDGDTTTVGN